MCLAVPGQIVALTDDGELSRSGRVSFGGLVREVNLSLVPDAVVGDFVLVHVGLALSRVDEEEARRTLEYLERIDELNELVRSPAARPSPAAPGAPPPVETGP